MHDRDYSSTLSLVEDKQNGLEFTRAALNEGGPTEGVFTTRDEEGALDHLLRRATYRSQAAGNPTAGLPGLNDQPSSAAEREL